ncbi:hypothetical protein SJ05684_c15930 [Sinorhizobium sojae CCBAU 05684]|uniref:CHRD domain-containing protein n=1 Tax=Sinorhizobium sojae CCBAU 05684 TaxID=716928 RepID=A0A249PB90_9HYPH|nr:CHRD domain-containing protein [Sinorhizobium sojae]ASY63035.1 hypothetical protein SJ05684_c15930 [Sinorhizobium sojae CCBAU 05684]
MQSWTKTTGIIVALGFLAAASAGLAEEMKFEAELKGSEEVPPAETGATGTADVTYDTESKNLTWTIEQSGLSGDVTAAHFHGPAAPGENAPPMVPIELSALSEGSATLDEAQASALTEGRMYINLHTAAHPDGEIRGQVVKAE